MRHTICADPAGKTAVAPASCARRVGHATAARALVALGGISPRGVASLAWARRSAVPLATVAVAAQQDLGAAGVRTGTGGRDGPCAPRANRSAGRHASQRATLLWHRLHRHGV